MSFTRKSSACASPILRMTQNARSASGDSPAARRFLPSLFTPPTVSGRPFVSANATPTRARNAKKIVASLCGSAKARAAATRATNVFANAPPRL